MATHVAATVATFLTQTTQAAMRSTGLGLPSGTISWSTWTLAGAFTCSMTLTANTAVTFPTSGTLATLAGAETLTNKTITSAALTTCTIGSAGVTFAGSSSGSTVLVAAAAASGTVIIPAGNDTLVNLTGTQTMQNKTFVAPVLGSATATTINGITPSASGTSSLHVAGAWSLGTGGVGGVTFASSGAATLTLPSGTVTLYGTGSGTITSAQLRTSLTDETGTGSAVFATSPTLVTPVIGAATGTSLVLSGAFEADTLSVGGASGFGNDLTVLGDITAGRVLGQLRPYMELVSADGPITLTSGTFHITKASAAALTVAAPSSQDGERLVIQSGSAFAHVVTFTGSTLRDGTTGAHVTATFAAFEGACLTVIARGSLWYVESFNAVTIT